MQRSDKGETIILSIDPATSDIFAKYIGGWYTQLGGFVFIKNNYVNSFSLCGIRAQQWHAAHVQGQWSGRLKI